MDIRMNAMATIEKRGTENGKNTFRVRIRLKGARDETASANPYLIGQPSPLDLTPMTQRRRDSISDYFPPVCAVEEHNERRWAI